MYEGTLMVRTYVVCVLMPPVAARGTPVVLSIAGLTLVRSFVSFTSELTRE